MTECLNISFKITTTTNTIRRENMQDRAKMNKKGFALGDILPIALTLVVAGIGEIF